METAIKLTFENAILDQNGVSREQLVALADKIQDARQEVLADVTLWESAKSANGVVDEEKIPASKRPLDSAFIRLPERLLSAYRENRDESELGKILTTAKRIRESCDRVVVLGIGGSYMGARALMDTCCHPYHNEQSRAQRGGRPRIYFEGNNVDNDAASGLLELLRDDNESNPSDWAIVVISKSGGTLETAVSFRLFLDALKQHCAANGHSDDKIGELVVPVTGSSGKLHELSTALGCNDIFEVPEGVGGRFSVLSPVGLLPAAIMGIDVVKLLEGAAAMNQHFETADVGSNLVLDYTALGHIMDEQNDANIRILSVWAKSLETVGLWYDQLLAESNGKSERGATPLTVVNTRDLHSRAQQHQEGARDKFITNVIVNKWRCDALRVPESSLNQDQLNGLAGRSMPEIMDAAIRGTNQAYLNDNRPTADLVLPQINEHTIGQLLQMLMLATVVEGRLMGINPYGQPGVEEYKRHMKQNLGM